MLDRKADACQTSFVYSTHPRRDGQTIHERELSAPSLTQHLPSCRAVSTDARRAGARRMSRAHELDSIDAITTRCHHLGCTVVENRDAGHEVKVAEPHGSNVARASSLWSTSLQAIPAYIKMRMRTVQAS